MSAFRYSPLGNEPDAVRILRVQGKDASTNYFSCTLETASLSNIDGAYIAVSHVWGSDDSMFKILLNGQIYFVTPQLWQFLKLAAERLPHEGLWVDAICIDQLNVAEKERQIPLMRHIYSKAQKLVAWLHSYIDGFYDRDLVREDPNFTAAPLIADDNYDIIEHLQAEDDVSRALLRLLFHPFWRRIWIVQELRLCEIKEFWWEGQVVSSKHLENIASNLATYFKEDPLNLNRVVWSNLCVAGGHKNSKRPNVSLFDHTAEDENGARAFLDAKEKFDLADMVEKYKHFERSIVYDCVFALLGISRQGDQFRARYNVAPIILVSQIWNISRRMNVEQCFNVGQIVGVRWSGRSSLARLTAWQDEMEKVLRLLQITTTPSIKEQITRDCRAQPFSAILSNACDHVRTSLIPDSALPTQRWRSEPKSDERICEPDQELVAKIMAVIKQLPSRWQRSNIKNCFVFSLSNVRMYYLCELELNNHFEFGIPTSFTVREVLKVTYMSRWRETKSEVVAISYLIMDEPTRKSVLSMLQRSVNTGVLSKLSSRQKWDGIIGETSTIDSGFFSEIRPAGVLALLHMFEDDHPMWRRARQWNIWKSC